MAYEDAIILRYEDRLIWIKRIGNYTYFTNDFVLSCLEEDAKDVNFVVRAINARYSPFFKKFDTNCNLLSCRRISGSDLPTPAMYSLSDNEQSFDKMLLDTARSEYAEWVESNSQVVYINDLRGMDMKVFINNYCTD